MAYAERVHLPVGISLMTDAALVNALVGLRSEADALTTEQSAEQSRLRYRLGGAIQSIERELRLREIDPAAVSAETEIAAAEVDVLRYVTVSEAA